MSKLPPPPGAFVAPFPSGAAGFAKAPLAAPGGGSAGFAAPKTFNAPPPNSVGKGPSAAPAPKPFSAPSPTSTSTSASVTNNNGHTNTFFATPASFQQQQQQQVPQAPTNPAAAKYCPVAAPSPSAPITNSSTPVTTVVTNKAAFVAPPFSSVPPPSAVGKFPVPATSPTTNISGSKMPPGGGPATNGNGASPFPTSGAVKPTFPQPGGVGGGGSSTGASASFPKPNPTPMGGGMPQQTQQLQHATAPTPSFGAKAPFSASTTGKFPAPPLNANVNVNSGNVTNNNFPAPPSTMSRGPSTAGLAPSPSPARPLVGGFPAPPPGFNQPLQQQQQQQSRPGFTPGGPSSSNSSASTPLPPGPTAPFGSKTIQTLPGPQFNNYNPMSNSNNSNNINSNSNSNMSLPPPSPAGFAGKGASYPPGPASFNQQLQQNPSSSFSPNTPGSQPLSYSSPITTGTPTGLVPQQPNQNQQQQQMSGNNSFNKLPDQQQQSSSSGSSSNQQQQQQAQQQQPSSGANIPLSSGKARMRAKPQGQNRIDSLQMPSPCRDLVVDGHPSYRYPPAPFGTSKSAATPPTAASCTPCLDEGNALPKFIRPTVHQLPWEEGALDKAKIPWGAVISPLCSKSVNIGGSALPVVNAPGTDPVRCSRCRAYMTSWNPFAGTGHSWVCAFCGMSNDVAESYFSPITNNGKRRDYLERPELCKGSYEIDVTGMEKYFAESPDTQKHIRPKPMNHLFVVDVSKNALGHMKSLVAAIREAVDQMPNSGYGMCSVSFVTYASTLHFYDFSNAKMPQMIVPDVDNPFVPLPFNLLCWMNVEEQREQIDSFLKLLESGELIDAVDETGCVIGAAAKVGQLILSDVGGMVILTGTSMPTAGCGIIPERDFKFFGDAKKEPELFKPQPGFWPNLAAESARRFVSFTTIMFPTSNSCDMITVGQLPHLTNGKQWIFSNFRDESDGLRLKRRVVHALNDEAGYGAILRTRCSAGIRVKAYHGHFMQTDPQDMDLALIDSHSSFYVAFVHDGKLEKKGAGIVQVALLYTTRGGFRRVRVHNLRMAVADTISNLFRYTDLESTLQAFISLSIHEAFNKGVKSAREWIVAKTVDLLVGYRVHSQTGSHSGQLLLPENLKLLPLYNLCLLKSDALVAGTIVRFEDRVQNMFELLTYPQDQLLFYLYPRLFGLHHLSQNAGEYRMSAGGDGSIEAEEEETEVGSRPKVFLPSLIQLTADNVYQGGIYLLQDLQARVVFLLIGSQVAPTILESAFGVDVPTGVSAVNAVPQMLSQINASTMDQWNPRARRIVQQLIDETGRFVIVREKSDAQMEDAFFRNLLEDQGPDRENCYSEFLCSLHKQINTKAKTM